jgi:hypothetical protein
MDRPGAMGCADCPPSLFQDIFRRTAGNVSDFFRPSIFQTRQNLVLCCSEISGVSKCTDVNFPSDFGISTPSKVLRRSLSRKKLYQSVLKFPLKFVRSFTGWTSASSHFFHSNSKRKADHRTVMYIYQEGTTQNSPACPEGSYTFANENRAVSTARSWRIWREIASQPAVNEDSGVEKRLNRADIQPAQSQQQHYRAYCGVGLVPDRAI